MHNSTRDAYEIQNDLVYELEAFPCLCIDGSTPHAGETAVDTGIDILGEYHLYISKQMTVEHGRRFGMIDATEVAALEKRAAEAEAKLAIVEGELAELQPIADSIARATQRMEQVA